MIIRRRTERTRVCKQTNKSVEMVKKGKSTVCVFYYPLINEIQIKPSGVFAPIDEFPHPFTSALLMASLCGHVIICFYSPGFPPTGSGGGGNGDGKRRVLRPSDSTSSRSLSSGPAVFLSTDSGTLSLKLESIPLLTHSTSACRANCVRQAASASERTGTDADQVSSHGDGYVTAMAVGEVSLLAVDSVSCLLRECLSPWAPPPPPPPRNLF